MAKNVTINFNTELNANGIKSAIYSLQEMQTVTKNVQQSLEGARTKWAQSAAAFETTISTVERLNGMLMSMASAYEETELNATRLDVVMKQRMKATNDQVEAVKALTSQYRHARP